MHNLMDFVLFFKKKAINIVAQQEHKSQTVPQSDASMTHNSSSLDKSASKLHTPKDFSEVSFSKTVLVF